MAITATVLARGAGWRATDVVCDAGPDDRPFEEMHDSVCIAVVTHGTFQYRTSQGSALLAPGGFVLGNPGGGFECGHEHGRGDRCVAFHYTPELFEAVVAEAPGAGRARFAVPCLPPVDALARLVAAAETARDDRDDAALEELALSAAGEVAGIAAQSQRAARAPSAREQRRVTDALRRIERFGHETLSLAELARDAAMSPWHFLRTFRRVAGITPHQFILGRRLHRAAVRLRASAEPIGGIALEAGFGDLSTFNRQFRRAMRASPGEYRARRAN